MDTTQQDTTQQESSQQDSLTVGDAVLMYNIISTVARRGAFEAEEFQIVGKLFEKLKVYVPKQEEATAETANTSEEVPDNQLSFDFAQGKEVEGEA